MIHLLLNPPHSDLARYDDSTGAIVGAVPRTEVWTGRCLRKGAATLALYVTGGHLVLQIGPAKYRLDDARVRIDYQHDWEAGQTTFRITDGTQEWSLTYPAWWHEEGLAPDAVKFQPERDEESDRLAFLHGVWRDPDSQRRLVGQWARG